MGGSAPDDLETLRAFLARVMPNFAGLPAPRSVSQALTRNAARLSAIAVLARDALDDAVQIIGKEDGAPTYAEAYIELRRWADGTLRDMSEWVRAR